MFEHVQHISIYWSFKVEPKLNSVNTENRFEWMDLQLIHSQINITSHKATASLSRNTYMN